MRTENIDLVEEILKASSITILMNIPIAPLRGDKIKSLRHSMLERNILFNRSDLLDMTILKELCNESAEGKYLTTYEGNDYNSMCVNLLYKLQFVAVLSANSKEIISLIEQFTIG